MAKRRRSGGGVWPVRWQDAILVAAAACSCVVGAGARADDLKSTHAGKLGALHRVAAAHAASLHDTVLDEEQGDSDAVTVNVTEAGVSGSNSTLADAAFTGGTNGSCLEPPRLHAYFVHQLFWTWVHTLEVSGVSMGEDGKEKTIPLGRVTSAPFSFINLQEWRAPDGKLVIMSHQDAISTVTNIYVEDCRKKAIATVSEQLAPSSSAVSQYTIQNTDGDIIGISTMSRNFGTEVDINDQRTGKRLVTVSKGWGELTDAWSATFRDGEHESLANEPRVLVMLLAAASASGSWGLGGPLAVMLNPLWLLLLFCCICAGCTAYARAQETEYDEIPAVNYGGGAFFGQGYTTGYGTGGGTLGGRGGFGGTQYV